MTSIDAKKKLLTKCNIHLWLKTLNKVGLEGMDLHIIKAIFEKPTVNSILNCTKLKALLLRTGTR